MPFITWMLQFMFILVYVGFASFCYILAFLLFSAGAVYASPLIMGSNNEKKMISSPQEIDSGYAAYGEDTPQSNV